MAQEKKAKKMEKDRSMYSCVMTLASRLLFVMALAMKDNSSHTQFHKHEEIFTSNPKSFEWSLFIRKDAALPLHALPWR